MSEVEVATTVEQAQSSSKREKVLEALAAGKSSAEAAARAECTIQYVYGIVRKQKESGTEALDEDESGKSAKPVSALSAEEPGLVQMDSVASPCEAENRKEPGLPSRKAISERIWPYTMERAGNRYKVGDDCFEKAATDAFEAADLFIIEARGHPAELVRLALVIWPTLFHDYGIRGRYITNVAVAEPSAALALSAAEKYLAHDSAP